MARWIMLGLTILGVALVFTTKSTGLLLLGLFCSLFGFFGFVFVLAADRISAGARPETSMAAADDLAALRKRANAPIARRLNATSAVAKSPAEAAPATTPDTAARALGSSDPSARRQTS